MSLSAILTLTAFLGFAPLGAALGGTIYDNGGGPPYFAGDQSDATSSAPFFTADNFTLAAGQNIIRDVHWAGTYFANSPTTDNFTVQFFNDTGSGAPQVTPFLSLPVGSVSRTNTGLDAILGFAHRYSVNVAPIVLTPGTQYWLSIFNDTGPDPADDWFWVGNPFSGGDYFVRSDTSAPWSLSTFGIRMDFQLTDDVAAAPEPVTLLLFGIGMIVFAISRGGMIRRRR
jgi:hypothetical protein